MASVETPPGGTPEPEETAPEEEPEPEAAPPEPAAGTRIRGRRGRDGKRRERTAQLAPATKGVTVFFAFILFALPVAAAPVGLVMKENELLKEHLQKLGDRFTTGLKKLDAKIFPPEGGVIPDTEPKDDVEAPPPPPEDVVPTEAEKEQDQARIIKTWELWARTKRDYETSMKTAGSRQSADLKPVAKEFKKLGAQLDDLCAKYKKIYGEDYDPRQENFDQRNP